MMHDSRPGAKQQDRGFTLIELLVVLVLVGLSLAVIGPRIGHSLDTNRLNASVRSVLATARAARNEARTEQRDVLVIFDVKNRTYRVDSAPPRRIEPITTKVKVTAAESERLSDERIGIRFFPDGSATGGTIAFGIGDYAQYIDVDWLTGFASISP